MLLLLLLTQISWLCLIIYPSIAQVRKRLNKTLKQQNYSEMNFSLHKEFMYREN